MALFSCLFLRERDHDNFGMRPDALRRSPCSGSAAGYECGVALDLEAILEFAEDPLCQDWSRPDLASVRMSRDLETDTCGCNRVHSAWRVLDEDAWFVRAHADLFQDRGSVVVVERGVVVDADDLESGHVGLLVEEHMHAGAAERLIVFGTGGEFLVVSFGKIYSLRSFDALERGGELCERRLRSVIEISGDYNELGIFLVHHAHDLVDERHAAHVAHVRVGKEYDLFADPVLGQVGKGNGVASPARDLGIEDAGDAHDEGKDDEALVDECNIKSERSSKGQHDHGQNAREHKPVERAEPCRGEGIQPGRDLRVESHRRGRHDNEAQGEDHGPLAEVPQNERVRDIPEMDHGLVDDKVAEGDDDKHHADGNGDSGFFHPYSIYLYSYSRKSLTSMVEWASSHKSPNRARIRAQRRRG